MPDLQITIVLDRDFDGIDQIGAFVFGLDAFRSKFRLFGNPGERTGIFPLFLFTEIDKDTHPTAELQLCKLSGGRISAEIQQIGVGYLIKRLAGCRDFTGFGIFHKDSACLRVDDAAFLQLVVQLHDLVDDTFRLSFYARSNIVHPAVFAAP